jgi:beta-lactamase class A
MSNKNINNTIEKLSEKLKYYKVWFIVLILAILVLAVVLIIQSSNKDSFTFGKFPLLDPSRAFLDQDKYLLNIQELRTYMHELEKQYPDSLSAYYEQINSGSNISVNRDLHLFPASLSKLAQAIIVAKKAEESILSWDKKMKILKEDISSDSGSLYQRVQEGSEISVEELLKELLVNSDNTAQNVFRRYLSATDYLNFQDLTGLQDLYNESGFISAKEYTRLLRVLYTSSYLEPENSEKILEYMSQSTFKDYLAQGVPSDIKFAHKYGENIQYNIFADSGIVYIPDRPYMLTVLIKGKDSSPETRLWAVNLMKEISEKAYDISK